MWESIRESHHAQIESFPIVNDSI